jgi:uncharacterized cupredoxin-like copper-binding protein
MRARLAGTLTLAAFALAACGGSSGGNSSAAPAAPSGDGNVAVQLGVGQELTVVAAPGKAAPGKVTFSVTNDGKIHHELVVVPLVTGSSPQALLTSSGEASEDGSPGEVPGIDPGQTKSVTIDLKPGNYVLLCNEPGHFAGGMATTFTVS